MADERSVHPEDAESTGGSVAGRPPGRWLDAETAERLLNGESPDSVDAASREQAERLVRTLAALTAHPTADDLGLPGEEAALAAFRKVRAERTDDWVSPPARGRHRAGDGGPADAGLVRIGAPDPKIARPRPRRPVHVGLAAVLAAGVVGGAAIVAATGMPGRSGADDPDPGASVSATASPDLPLLSPSPFAPALTPSPDASPSGGAGSRDTARGDTGAGSGGQGVRPGGDWDGAASACRDIRDGKNLTPSRERSLESAAGGSPRVWTYCKGVLAQGDTKAGPDGRKGTGKDGYEGHKDNEGNDSSQGDGDGGDNDKSGRGDANDGRFTAPRKSLRNPNSGGTAASGAPIASLRATMSPSPDMSPDPSPTYSAL